MTEKEPIGGEPIANNDEANATNDIKCGADATERIDGAIQEEIANASSNIASSVPEADASSVEGEADATTAEETIAEGNESEASIEGEAVSEASKGEASTECEAIPAVSGNKPAEPVTACNGAGYEQSIGSSGAVKAKKDKGSLLMPLATVLSGISILGLFILMIAIMLGVILVGGDRDSTQVQISGSNSQITYTDDTEMIADFIDSVVIVSVERTTGTGVGSGIIYSQNGYIVTNYHVVSDTVAIYVKLHGDSDYIKAELVGYSEHDDVAVLKIDKTGLRPATFVGDCSTCLLGERVYAIGSPEGTDYSWTVTQGIISSVNRILKFYDNDGVLEKKMRVIQTDAAVNPGNSGGPLINSRGEVVGIITMKLDESAGMGFALPSDGVLTLVNAIIETGSADHIESTIASGRPLMGITCVSVQKNKWYKNTIDGIEEISKAYAVTNPDNTFYAAEDGVYVKGTSVGMDAHGKLKEGDIITEINGTRVYTQYQLMSVINDLVGGDSVSITYYRDGEFYTVDITLKGSPIQ